MIWALKGLPAPIDGRDGKDGKSKFVFINGAGEVFQVHGNIDQSTSEQVLQKFRNFVELFDKEVGE